MLAGVTHVFFMQAGVDGSGGNDPLADAAPQVAGGQHPCGRVFGVVAIAVFLVAQPDFDGILVARGGNQPGPGALVLDQRIQAHRRAVDAQVGVRDDLGRGDAGFFLDQGQPVADRQRGILRRGQRFEDAHFALTVGKDEIGERAAGVDAQTIFVLHGLFPSIRVRRQSAVALSPRHPRPGCRGP